MTSTPLQTRHRYSYDEYLAYERDCERKHEYDDGQILAMAGGSLRHSALAARLGIVLGSRLPSSCILLQSDARVRVLATGRATYPDVSMVCGPIEKDPADPKGETLANPTLIIEVLSPSTEHNDRGEKWWHYQQIPSLQEYVLISQFAPCIERYRRIMGGGGGWEYRAFTQGTVELVSGAVIDLASLYDGLPP